MLSIDPLNPVNKRKFLTGIQFDHLFRDRDEFPILDVENGTMNLSPRPFNDIYQASSECNVIIFVFYVTGFII